MSDLLYFYFSFTDTLASDVVIIVIRFCVLCIVVMRVLDSDKHYQLDLKANKRLSTLVEKKCAPVIRINGNYGFSKGWKDQIL